VNSFYEENSRIARGGSYRSSADHARSASRAYAHEGYSRAGLGFRVARSGDSFRVREKPAPKTPQTAAVYKIGDTGPGGGVVFYDKGRTTDGWRYLEAAPEKAQFRGEFGVFGHYVEGTKSDVGAGAANTELYRTAMSRFNTTAKQRNYKPFAPLQCAELSLNGCDDWFLPSQEELDLMYANMGNLKPTGFYKGWYWSSTQFSSGDRAYDASYVQSKSFGSNQLFDRYYKDGDWHGLCKDNTLLARPIRSF
jgi:hypothetical protein